MQASQITVHIAKHQFPWSKEEKKKRNHNFNKIYKES